MYIRISRGHYSPDLHFEVTARLAASSNSLVPAIRQLPGCVNYYAALDEASCTMINVSVWDTLEHAQAMSSLAAMSDLAQEFIKLGVEFERPIVNYELLWQLP